MMPARLGEGVIAMLPRSPRLTITPAPGAARGLAKAVEGATLALAKFGAAVGQVLAASMARTPARKPGVALLPGRRTAKKFGGVPIVRIHFPPAASPLRTRLPRARMILNALVFKATVLRDRLLTP
jgi:hypothetical protein